MLSEEADLAVIDPPKISQHPESKSVATGASTTFTVEATGDDLHFKWMKDGKELHDGRKYCGTKTHTLRIKDVEKSDKGIYQCLVKNDVDKELSEEADLAVSIPLTLQNIDKILIEVVDWHTLGIKLGLPVHKLRRIESNYSVHGLDWQRHEMISTWLEYDTEASWGKLASALKEMGMHVAAKKIAGNVEAQP